MRVLESHHVHALEAREREIGEPLDGALESQETPHGSARGPLEDTAGGARR